MMSEANNHVKTRIEYNSESDNDWRCHFSLEWDDNGKKRAQCFFADPLKYGHPRKNIDEALRTIQGGAGEMLEPIFKVPPQNLCLHKYEPAIHTIKGVPNTRCYQCIHCGKIK